MSQLHCFRREDAFTLAHPQRPAALSTGTYPWRILPTPTPLCWGRAVLAPSQGSWNSSPAQQTRSKVLEAGRPGTPVFWRWGGVGSQRDGQWILKLKNYQVFNYIEENNLDLKGTIAWDGFFAHYILYRIERKDLKFFSCCTNIYWLRARFNRNSFRA